MRSKTSPQERTDDVNRMASASTRVGVFFTVLCTYPELFPFIGKAIGIKGAFFSGPEEEASHWL